MKNRSITLLIIALVSCAQILGLHAESVSPAAVPLKTPRPPQTPRIQTLKQKVSQTLAQLKKAFDKAAAKGKNSLKNGIKALEAELEAIMKDLQKSRYLQGFEDHIGRATRRADKLSQEANQ